jgi:hypothetical protein
MSNLRFFVFAVVGAVAAIGIWIAVSLLVALFASL